MRNKLWATLAILSAPIGLFIFVDKQTRVVVASETQSAAPTAVPPSGKTPEKSETVEHSKSKKNTSSENACLVDQNAIEDVEREKAELANLRKELKDRELELGVKEKALQEEFKKIEGIRDQIVQAEGLKKKENEERVAKLVETFETMAPKSAGQILGTLDETLAVAAMSKLSTPKLAKILGTMETAKSSRLSELMAGLNRRIANVDGEKRGIK